ncbi:hypothetical protein [Pelobacter seleniigenes]|uniref:hypothetical protein n=1 Tax=Pelobacter seleniigenes TaxID=407188 RepID=UPI0004A7831E|nr:hypothetical protein [Pelobacter seleniigenes]
MTEKPGTVQPLYCWMSKRHQGLKKSIPGHDKLLKNRLLQFRLNPFLPCHRDYKQRLPRDLAEMAGY